MAPDRFKHYVLGDEIIDLQHKIIFDLSIEILEKIKLLEDVSDLVKDILIFIKHHFEYEADDMKNNNYTFIDHHLRQHALILDTSSYLQNLSVKDGSNFAEILEVLVNHVDFDDRNYVEWKLKRIKID